MPMSVILWLFRSRELHLSDSVRSCSISDLSSLLTLLNQSIRNFVSFCQVSGLQNSFGIVTCLSSTCRSLNNLTKVYFKQPSINSYHLTNQSQQQPEVAGLEFCLEIKLHVFCPVALIWHSAARLTFKILPTGSYLLVLHDNF